MRITKKITSIVLAVLMVVSMMSVMAVTASAAEYNANDGIQLSASQLAVGDVILTENASGTSIKHEDYKFTMKGGTYSVGSVDNPQADDVVAPELDSTPIFFSYLNTADFAMVFQDKNFNNTYYYPLDAEGNLSKKWYVLAADHENKTITFGGHVPAPAIPTISTAEELYAACYNGGEYNLAADITTEYNYVEKDTIIHGNGHTIKSGSADYSIFYWYSDKNADLTLDNVTLDGNGTKGIAVTVHTGDSSNSGCNVTFDTVTCQNFDSNFSQGVGAVYLYGSSNGTFTNCTFDNNTVSETGTNGFSGADIWFGGAGNLVISGGSYDEVYVNGGTASATVSNGAAIDSLNAAKGSKIATDSPEKISVGEDYKLKNNDDGSYTVVPKDYVAQIGDNKYETLEEAFAAAVDGDKIEVLADCSGNGIQVIKNTFATGLTVDFGGHTYTMDGATVGSPGTQTLAFQLQYGNNITFKNGTLYSEKAKMLVQNYSNLTLDGMTLTFNNTSYNGAYTLSNNNGNTVIKDTTINANPTPGSFAFDVCRGGGSNSYPSVNVTVTGNSKINGNVEVYAKNADPKNGFSLKLLSGTMTGNIVVDPTAKAVLDAKSDKAEVTKNNEFGQTAPEGLVWEDNGNGTSSLVPVEVNPLDALITRVTSDGNKFGITSQYYAGTILGVQKKEKITNAGVTSDKGAQEAAEGSDMRFVAVLDTEVLRDADDYGFVLAKVGSDKNIASVGNEGLDKLKKGDDRFKTISAMNTYNTVCGTSAAAKKYGDPTDATTAYKYITCAVNGVDDSSKIVARFYVVKDGKTYYGKYAGHSYKYRGAVAGISDLV